MFFGENVIWPADPQMTDPMSPPAALDARLDADHTRSPRSNEKKFAKAKRSISKLK